MATHSITNDAEIANFDFEGIRVRDFQLDSPLTTVPEVDDAVTPLVDKIIEDEFGGGNMRTRPRAASRLTRIQSTPLLPTSSEILEGYEAFKRGKSLEIPHRPGPSMPFRPPPTPPASPSPQVRPQRQTSPVPSSFHPRSLLSLNVRSPRPVPTRYVRSRPEALRSSQSPEAEEPNKPILPLLYTEGESLESQKYVPNKREHPFDKREQSDMREREPGTRERGNDIQDQGVDIEEQGPRCRFCSAYDPIPQARPIPSQTEGNATTRSASGRPSPSAEAKPLSEPETATSFFRRSLSSHLRKVVAIRKRKSSFVTEPILTPQVPELDSQEICELDSGDTPATSAGTCTQTRQLPKRVQVDDNNPCNPAYQNKVDLYPYRAPRASITPTRVTAVTEYYGPGGQTNWNLVVPEGRYFG